MQDCYLDTLKKSSCCGCKVCASVCSKKAISFNFDEEGFWYPQIDELKCIHCNMCHAVCPFSEDELSTIIDENQTYAAYAKSEDVLKRSASGGVFSVLSDVIIEEGGTVFGHIYDEKCRAVCVSAKTKDERNRMCGSKYVQSDMKDIYSEIKSAVKTEKMVLFTGTPCQVEAVNNYFKKNIPENLITVGLICHGVPSPKIFSEYIALEEKKSKKQIKEVIFRGKGKGWTMPLREFHYLDGSFAAKLLNADAFNNLFLGTDCILRPSCFECRYAGKKRIEDITIADFWGIQNKHPEMFNDNKGVSVMLVNTDKGKKLFSKCKNNFITKQVPLFDAQEGNTPLKHPSVPFRFRNRVFEEYKKHGAGFILKKYIYRRIIISSLPVRAIRKILRIAGGGLKK